MTDIADRLIRFQNKPPRKRIELNRVYDALRSGSDAFLHMGDITVLGSTAITNAASTLATVALSNTSFPATTPNWRVKQWPDAVQVYLLLRHFSICPTTGGAVGDLQCSFQDAAGGSIQPLGDYNAATGGISPHLQILIPSPIQDSASPTLGTLNINWLGGAAGITVGWSLGFSGVYLLPSMAPHAGDYDRDEIISSLFGNLT